MIKIYTPKFREEPYKSHSISDGILDDLMPWNMAQK